MKARSRLQPDKPSEDFIALLRHPLPLPRGPLRQITAACASHTWLFSFLLRTSKLDSVKTKTATGHRPAAVISCGERGIRTPGTRNYVRQFSKLLVSATHPSHQYPLKEAGYSRVACGSTCFTEENWPIQSIGTAKILIIYCFAIFSRISVSAWIFFIL